MSLPISANKKLILIAVSICLLPSLLTLFGADFSSFSAPNADFVQTNVAGVYSSLTTSLYHVMLEWTAVTIASITALASLIHYKENRDVTVPIIGMALLCTSFVDGFYIFTAMQVIGSQSSNVDVIPFNWTVSRIFNASVMLVGAIISYWLFQQQAKYKASLNNWLTMSGISLTFCLASYLTISFTADLNLSSEQIYQDALLTRPLDIIPLIIFSLCGWFFWLWYKKEKSNIKFALMLSIIPAIVTQLHMAFGSSTLFDSHFNIAHGLKIVAYLSILIGIILDLIGKQKEQAAKLAEAHKYIDGITNSVPFLLSYIDHNQVYQFTNANYPKWFGNRAHRFIGNTVQQSIGNNMYRRLEAPINKVLSGEAVSFDSFIVDKHNLRRDVHINYTPDLQDNGEVSGFFVTVEDITESKSNESRLKDLSWRLDFALAAPNIGVWDYNLETQELLWDERMYSLFGLNSSQNVDAYKVWEKAMHPDDIDKVRKELFRCIKVGKDFNVEFRIIWPNKEIHFIEAHAKLFSNEHGRFTRIIGTNTDITAQKTLQIEREQALEKAQESTKLKSEFLASMSHEIRTPMNGVLGMLSLILQSKLEPEQHHYANLAKTSAESLLNIINDILDFSKIEAGKMELELLDFNLRGLIGDFAEAIAERAHSKGLELIVDVTQIEQSMVCGDPGRIRQILTNLVGNAIKFTEQGEVVIRAELTDSKQGYYNLTCSVTDTGIGISEKQQQAIFSSFTQVDASTTRKYGGTGLGLSIVKQLCHLMQGTIEVSSEQGKGSCFTFTIEIAKGEEQAISQPKVDISNSHILIVDDNQTSRQVMAKQLTLWGAKVSQADDATSALQQLSMSPSIQVAFIDMHMSTMDGLELGKKIRQNHQWQSLKLVMMKSMASRGDDQLISNIGFDAYFRKPITIANLQNTLSLMETEPNRNPIAKYRLDTNLTTETNKPTTSKWPEHLRILLVEDNVINQTVAEALLQTMDLTCDIVNNGLEALDALKQAPQDRPYTLLLMDCQMPEMDGYEATRAIRAGQAGDKNAAVAIIALTANAMKGDKDKCIQAGMDDYLTKPIDEAKLEQKIRQWTNQTRSLIDCIE
ncbi:hypothetical protein C2869_20900 [Saccharobesus litoralis]|uniref:Sensory/regulatory protein RpfC n=1 Tax=Saccharobesus litoralis TaxID=2172099 RepID=A0A2S0VX02_9ALTE|nr:response regulator [Saccharobesus litoralis]AWB68702.1 hypothetical protein C2869_20900 [Saccharobesus litoralis]